jgi:hypothetical protein
MSSDSKPSIGSRLQQAQNFLMKAGEIINEIQFELKPNGQTQNKPAPSPAPNPPQNKPSTASTTEIRNLRDGDKKNQHNRKSRRRNPLKNH